MIGLLCVKKDSRQLRQFAGRTAGSMPFGICDNWIFSFVRITISIENNACMCGDGSVGVVVGRHPVSVGEPQGIGDCLGAIMVTVPLVVGVRSVLDLQRPVPKACLSERRVPWLRLCEATMSHLRLSVNGKKSAAFLLIHSLLH
jgi:hypothetical protein